MSEKFDGSPTGLRVWHLLTLADALAEAVEALNEDPLYRPICCTTDVPVCVRCRLSRAARAYRAARQGEGQRENA